MSHDGGAIIHPSERSFQSQVIESDVPVLVDFWATWCPPCRMLKPELERLAPELAGRARIAMVNVDEHPALAQAFQVRGIPALFIVKNGAVVDGWTGFMPRDEVKSRLEAHMSGEPA